jgi:hypothetical protein
VLPNEFLQNEEFSVDHIINKFSKIIDTPAFSLPSKRNSGHQLPNELPADLLHAPLVWVRYGGVPPLQQPLRGHLCQLAEVLHGCRRRTSSLRCRKQPPTASMAAKPATTCHGGLPAAKQVSFVRPAGSCTSQ